MIIFFNKQTGEIIGTIDGRVHDEHIRTKVSIKRSDIPDEQIGKYVVPFNPVEEIVEEPIKELRVVDERTRRVAEVVVGTHTVKRVKEALPAVSFKNVILDLESRRVRPSALKVETDATGEVTNITQKHG